MYQIWYNYVFLYLSKDSCKKKCLNYFGSVRPRNEIVLRYDIEGLYLGSDAVPMVVLCPDEVVVGP